MKVTYYSVWMLSLVVVQTTVLNYLKIFNVKPNLFLIFIICIALLNGARDGAVVGLILGFAADIAGGKILGLNALLCMYAGVVCGVFFRSFLKKKYLVIVVTVFIITFLYGILFNFMSFAMWGKGDTVYAVLNIILPEAVYNAAACIPVYLLVMKTSRRVFER